MDTGRGGHTTPWRRWVATAAALLASGGGRLIVKKVKSENVTLAVADNGPGIALPDQKRIFDKFYRANAANAAVPGTGLGMTIVKYLVDAHHGQITIDSAVGVGTTVKIHLPRTHVTEAPFIAFR